MIKLDKIAAMCGALTCTIMPLMAINWTEGVPTEVTGAPPTATTATLQLDNFPPTEHIEYRLWDEAILGDDRISARPASKERDKDSDNYSSTNRQDPLMKVSQSRNIRINAPSFIAFTSDELHSFPPNVAGAAGPTQLLICANGGIRSFDKATGIADGAIDMNSDAFFALVSNGQQTTDPRVHYDRATDRWFILMRADTPARLLIAVSDAGTISQNTVWSFFHFLPSQLTPARDVTGLIEDFATLGVDDHALYIGLNLFRQDNGSLENSDGYVIRKSSVLGAGPLVATAFRNLIDENGVGLISPQGVTNFDSNPTYGYFIGVDQRYFGQLDLRVIKDAATTPSISPNTPLTIFATVYPLLVDHLDNKKGLRGYLDPIDDRLADSHIRDGKLYTVHNVGVNYRGISSYNKPATRTGSRWYEIDLSFVNRPVLTHAGTVYAASKLNSPHHRSFYTPSVMTNGPHSLVLGSNSSGKNYHIDATFAIRHVTDEEGTMRGPYFFTQTPFAYNPVEDNGSMRGRRWGDYSAMSIDPSDNMSLWAIQPYCHDDNKYAIRAMIIHAAPPAKLIDCSPSSAAAGNNNLLLHLTGEQVKGSSFYDPGVGFDKRLSVTIDGVIVSTVTWIDAKHIDVNVSTVGATAGAKRITVTNPDGQVVFSDILFSIQ